MVFLLYNSYNPIGIPMDERQVLREKCWKYIT